MFIDLLRSRRSVRQYENRPIESEKIDLLMEAVLRSPASRGVNPWEFIVVQDSSLIGRLAKAKPHGAAFLAGAPLAVAVAPQPEKSDVWVEDVSIATLVLHLAATDLGLGSCWIQLRKRNHDDAQTAGEYAARILGLPQGRSISAIVAMGYAAKQPDPHPKSALAYEKISFDQYGKR